MKNLMIAFILTLICSVSFSQGSDDLNSLKKQVNSLKSRNSKIELRLKEHINASKQTSDSLKKQLEANDIKLKALTDSIATRDAKHSAIECKVHSMHHSIRVCNTFLYILLIIIILALVGIYLLTIRRIEAATEKSEKKLTDAKENIENELNKTKKELIAQIPKDFDAQISSIKAELAKLKEQKE
jgi:hypothetical protein